MEILKYVTAGIVGACVLLFARRWHELKQKESKLQLVELENKIEVAHEKTQSMPTDDLVDRENERFLSGFYKYFNRH